MTTLNHCNEMSVEPTKSPADADLKAFHRDVRLAWKAWIRAGNPTYAYHFLAYAWLRGDRLDKVFTPVTRVRRLNNGHAPYREACAAYRMMFWTSDAWAPFASLVSPWLLKDGEVWPPKNPTWEERRQGYGWERQLGSVPALAAHEAALIAEKARWDAENAQALRAMLK